MSRRTIELFTAVLDAIERTPASDVLIMPVVHDALGPEEDLLAALCRSSEGELLLTADRGPGARGPINRPLAQVVQATFNRINYPITIVDSGQQILASFDDHANPEGGLATALRTVEVLVSSEIDQA
ncbi:MAG: hypothetical protein J7513_16965, partial [Solirubrobacteraceae bacterium]|nr:hypothetical protein [Solirubrobacteraceae bacterium]